MTIFEITLVVTTMLCTLVAGLVFAFSVVVMPGIRTLSDGQFLEAFQVIDRVIQNKQPVFILVWVGSVVALMASAAVGFGQLDDTGRVLVVAALVVYVLGVQLPTVIINLPLNNKVQTLEIDDMDQTARAEARRTFESRWNASNATRTVLACVVSVLLMLLLLRI